MGSIANTSMLMIFKIVMKYFKITSIYNKEVELQNIYGYYLSYS